MTQQINNKRLTPLEKLNFDKQRLLQESRNQEQKISEHFSYLQEHAGSLIFSGITSLLFPSSKSTAKKEESKPAHAPNALPAVSLGAADYLSIAKGMLPLAWDLAQPLLLTWGIKKAKKWLTHLIFGKKK